MRKECKILAVLSTAAVMTAVTPSVFVPGLVQTAFAASAGWVEEEGSLRYKDSDGYYLTDSWKKKDNQWYYLDEDGHITRSSQVDEYYVDEDGKRVSNQWVSVSNEDEWDDEMPETSWYYYGKDGKSVVSRWQTIDGKDYYFNDEGHMQTGKLELNGFHYYLGDENDGVMKTGWIQLENEDEYADEDMVWHYFDSNGRMVMNQVDRKIDGSYYTFENGILQTGWYRLPVEETATASNAAEPSIASYQYYEENGKRADGWYQIEGGYVSSDYVAQVDAAVASASGKGSEIAKYAQQYVGYPYVYGGSSPRGFDCSGFVTYVCKQFGHSVNRTASAQMDNGTAVSKSQLQPGDLVFFNNGNSRKRATHVGIYIGGNQFVHASTPTVGVIVSDMNSAYYGTGFVGARRLA